MRIRLVIAVVLVALLVAASARAVEPWVDSGVKETAGLVLWLDASAQNRARQAEGVPSLLDGALCAVVYDGSGHKRNVVARRENASPRFVLAGKQALLRFDGQDDCLEATGLGLSLDTFTLAIIVAPKSNAGEYRAFVSANALGRNDYQSGFNVDMSRGASTKFACVNIEGKGCDGAVNLMQNGFVGKGNEAAVNITQNGFDFGGFHTVHIVSSAGTGGVQLAVDGRPHGRRDRGTDPVTVDELELGARFYNNGAKPPCLQGFLEGDIAELLLFDRALSDDERLALDEYLTRKQADLNAAVGRRREAPLKPVDHPPAVQMFVPGFEVHELPVDLSNINSIKYRDDGKLVALAYDGRIYLLSDSDGDGLEDKVETFWDQPGLISPIGMALTPPGYARGRGVFVPSKGKLSLIVDTDGDDKADSEIKVAKGWKPLHHNVDALGVAIDRDGSIYFGLGTQDYTKAYLLDAEGKSHVDLHNERGTVLKVSPDFKKRKIFCTGVRFTVAMAFNRQGDLFCTDQEGATWLPNGNPFDELLHLQSGRHYGFPPRHPKYLPDVIDEPSTFDYRPQHQSACGLNFNDSVNGGPTFGPAWWAGDAIVSGSSRGKLYRTKLVKSPSGYVADTTLFACLNKLTIDACLSPRGSLVVATHSGGPDWGAGPKGKGKLYQVSLIDPEAPQPVRAWASSPHETRVAFDRPLDPRLLANLSSSTRIQYGSSVVAGDRFESVRPGYKVVQRQLVAPRYELPLRVASVTADRRTFVLATDEQSQIGSYAISLPGLSRAMEKRSPGALPQEPAIDLAYDLCGVEARWQDSTGATRWSGWLPHFDLAVARELTVGMADCEPLWPLLEQPGRLTLKTGLDLANLLHPVTQPGSQLDYEPTPEEASITITASGPLEAKVIDQSPQAVKINGDYRAEVSLGVVAELAPLEVAMTTGQAKSALTISYHTAEDARARPLERARFLLPWARRDFKDEEPSERLIPAELAGGDWIRGRKVFLSDEALCSKCHRIGAVGGSIGPDLSNLAHRDYASVLRDITEPSFAINPDFINYNVVLEDGRMLSGVVHSNDERLVVGDKQGHETSFLRDEIEQLVPQTTSIMPEGLPKVIGPEKFKDLLTFLLMPPPEELRPAAIAVEGAPPPRSRADVAAAIAAAGAAEERPLKPLKIVLVDGEKDHGVNAHDYPLWARRWQALLGLAKDVTVSVTHDWPSAEDLQTADLMVWYSANAKWNAKKANELEAFLSRGGGLCVLHYALSGQKAPAPLAERFGLVWKMPPAKFRHGPIDVVFGAAHKHPITAGFERLHLEDESYWNLTGDPARVQILATGEEDRAEQPLVWVRQHGRGRVFCTVLGHYTWTFDDPLFRLLILRGMAWTTNEPVGRFNELTTIGARLAD